MKSVRNFFRSRANDVKKSNKLNSHWESGDKRFVSWLEVSKNSTGAKLSQVLGELNEGVKDDIGQRKGSKQKLATLRRNELLHRQQTVQDLFSLEIGDESDEKPAGDLSIAGSDSEVSPLSMEDSTLSNPSDLSNTSEQTDTPFKVEPHHILLFAAKSGKTNIVKHLLRSKTALEVAGAPKLGKEARKKVLEATDADGNNLLHILAQNGEHTLINLLVKHYGRDVDFTKMANATNNLGKRTPLDMVFNRYDFYEGPTNHDTVDAELRTPMLVKALIDVGSNTFASFSDGYVGCKTHFDKGETQRKTPGATHLKKTLQEGGFQENLAFKSDNEQTRLHFFAKNGEVERLKQYLQTGNSKLWVHKKDVNGNTSLHLAMGYAATHLNDKNAWEAIEVLLKNGANPSTPNSKLETPVVAFIKGLPQNVANDTLLTALSTLKRHGIFNGTNGIASLGVPDGEKGNTALHYLVNKGQEAVEALTRNPDTTLAQKLPQLITTENNAGETPVDIALANNDFRTVALLLLRANSQAAVITAMQDVPKADGSITFTFGYAASGKTKKFDFNAQNAQHLKKALNKAKFGLENAIIHGNIDAVKKLIECGANPDVCHNNFTPLYLATSAALRSGNTDLINLLRQNGAKDNTKSTNGQTPMHLLVEHGSPEFIKQAIAYITETDNNGNNLLHIAASRGADVTKALVRRNSTFISSPATFEKYIPSTNNAGKTPIEVALDKGDVDTARYLFITANAARAGSIQLEPLATGDVKLKYNVKTDGISTTVERVLLSNPTTARFTTSLQNYQQELTAINTPNTRLLNAAKGFNPDYPGEKLDPKKIGGVFCACRNADLVRVVPLDKPTNLLAKDAEGKTVLHHLAAHNQEKILDECLKAVSLNALAKELETIINVQDNNGHTPLYALLATPSPDKKVLGQLVKLGADISSPEIQRLLAIKSQEIQVAVRDARERKVLGNLATCLIHADKDKAFELIEEIKAHNYDINRPVYETAHGMIRPVIHALKESTPLDLSEDEKKKFKKDTSTSKDAKKLLRRSTVSLFSENKEAIADAIALLPGFNVNVLATNDGEGGRKETHVLEYNATGWVNLYDSTKWLEQHGADKTKRTDYTPRQVPAIPVFGSYVPALNTQTSATEPRRAIDAAPIAAHTSPAALPSTQPISAIALHNGVVICALALITGKKKEDVENALCRGNPHTRLISKEEIAGYLQDNFTSKTAPNFTAFILHCFPGEKNNWQSHLQTILQTTKDIPNEDERTQRRFQMASPFMGQCIENYAMHKAREIAVATHRQEAAPASQVLGPIIFPPVPSTMPSIPSQAPQPANPGLTMRSMVAFPSPPTGGAPAPQPTTAQPPLLRPLPQPQRPNAAATTITATQTASHTAYNPGTNAPAAGTTPQWVLPALPPRRANTAPATPPSNQPAGNTPGRAKVSALASKLNIPMGSPNTSPVHKRTGSNPNTPGEGGHAATLTAQRNGYNPFLPNGGRGGQ